jgi:hypothetical protein
MTPHCALVRRGRPNPFAVLKEQGRLESALSGRLNAHYFPSSGTVLILSQGCAQENSCMNHKAVVNNKRSFPLAGTIRVNALLVVRTVILLFY